MVRATKAPGHVGASPLLPLQGVALASVRPGEILLPPIKTRSLSDWLVADVDRDRCCLVPLGEVSALRGEITVSVDELELTAIIASSVEVSAAALAASLHVCEVSRSQLRTIRAALAAHDGSAPASSPDPDEAEWREQTEADASTLCARYPLRRSPKVRGVRGRAGLRDVAALAAAALVALSLDSVPIPDLARYEARGFGPFAARLAGEEGVCAPLELSALPSTACAGGDLRLELATSGRSAAVHVVYADDHGRSLGMEPVGVERSRRWRPSQPLTFPPGTTRVWVVIEPLQASADSVSAARLEAIVGSEGIHAPSRLTVMHFSVAEG